MRSSGDRHARLSAVREETTDVFHLAAVYDLAVPKEPAYAVNVDGSGLERITYAADFDGFPMFSPDGKSLVFASNRNSKPGTWDTNLFVARWQEGAAAKP